MLADDLADRPAERETALKIASAVRGLDGVVGDVLSFARPISPQHDACTAQELFDDALAACAACLQREGIEVRREDAQRRPVAIECDGTLVRQALINVVRNAIEAIAGAGDPSRERTVTLDASRTRVREKAGDAAPMISLRVRDTGPGVTPEVVARMFNPFFTTRHTGTGLGLAIVHRIVDAHGGRVRVRNAPEGGAVVELLLPAEPGARSQRHDRDTETPTP
ncbi:MAG: hypothetical protein EA379_05775 [Phycisphaerales bacterium]|nr:MAG: hypothetical protein EA379_05775 [Phycisphaerales bacterium]